MPLSLILIAKRLYAQGSSELEHVRRYEEKVLAFEVAEKGHVRGAESDGGLIGIGVFFFLPVNVFTTDKRRESGQTLPPTTTMVATHVMRLYACASGV